MAFEIILAHGVLGFGDEGGPGHFIQYFRGVAALYGSLGHTVVAPGVDPLGSVDRRAAQLASAIRGRCVGNKLRVIAHSMGGLDMRRVIARHPDIAQRVRTLVTIATPHLGSPVADAILDGAHPLRNAIPPALLEALRPATGALEDLHSRGVPLDPDLLTEWPGIERFNIACNAAQADGASPFFALAARIGALDGESNDGVVTRSSALRPDQRPLADWPVDHGGAIGWPSGAPSSIFDVFIPTKAHLARYAELLKVFA